MGNLFFYRPLSGQTLHKSFRVVIIKVFIKNCFWNHVLTSGSAKTRDPWKWKCRFSSLGTSQGPILNLNLKSFLIKSLIIIIFKKNCGAFRLKKWRLKKWIFHYIFNIWFARGRVSFFSKQISENAKHPKICISFGGSMPESQIK